MEVRALISIDKTEAIGKLDQLVADMKRAGEECSAGNVRETPVTKGYNSKEVVPTSRVLEMEVGPGEMEKFYSKVGAIGEKLGFKIEFYPDAAPITYVIEQQHHVPV